MTTTKTFRVTQADQAANPYYYVPFDVPAGTTRIDVVLAYPKADDCIIDLGCFDPGMADFPSPTGFRGWSGGFRERFFVATDDATPGYIHGAMPPGTWNVILGLYKVPPAGADVTVSVDLDSSPRPLAPPPPRTFPQRKGAGWYKGDLHCHTFHSDAHGSPETLHAQARQAGLDFLAVADHNTITQRRYFHAASSPDLVFIRGMEVTTATGHANVFGVDAWIDFRITRGNDVHLLEKAVHQHGGLLSINHDKPVIPWDYELPAVDCQEVWQSTWFDHNWTSLERWQTRLSKGLRISAIGGSDYHQPAELQPEGPLVLARPTTVLWLENLSEDNVLAAMKAGRGYITESPTGPHLAIKVNDVPMGGITRNPLTCLAEIRGAKGDTLTWIDATGIIAEQDIHSDDCIAELALLDGASTFIRAEIIAKSSHSRLVNELLADFSGEIPQKFSGFSDHPIRRALSNPVYIES